MRQKTSTKRKAHRCITLKMAIYSGMMIIPRKRGNRWFWLFKDREDDYSLWIWFCHFCGEILEKRKRNWSKNMALASIIISPIVSFVLLGFIVWRNAT